MIDVVPASPNPSPRARSTLLIVAALLLGAIGALMFAPAGRHGEPETAEDTSPIGGRDCLRLSSSKADYFSSEAVDRANRRLIAACRAAHAEHPDDVDIKVALGKALTVKDRNEAVALLRSAAAKNSAEANYQLYEQHRSWDQHMDRPQLVSRAEAEGGLRRAAELRHPEATMMLAILLDRGTTVKRNAAEARMWAARAMENPQADGSRAGLLVFLGRLLSQSPEPDERARGRDMLEKLVAAGGPYNAKTTLAKIIRAEDPIRARALLEAALRPDPGGAPPVLADMLVKGEGGPADPARAVRLVSAPSDVGAVHGALGRLMLEGTLVPRNVPKAIDLIRHEGVWDIDVQTEVVRLLGAHPEVQIEFADRFLYAARQAAELDEPNATAALIELRFSQHPQFRDVADGCYWIGIAKSRGE